MINDKLLNEIPNPKSQIPNKSQAPNPKFQTKSVWDLVIGIWNLFGAWCLEFEIFFKFGFDLTFVI